MKQNKSENRNLCANPGEVSKFNHYFFLLYVFIETHFIVN
ncbi:unnamed protein product [marine sediment metagenome]|uniref:Uncharacterized protein n=1 Tax=marine sediment metagenome TaxID=412755 RepID=X1CQV4_9ZZZZ